MSETNNNPAAAPSETTESTISAARLAANRENAQKSCGPTSPEGKAKSCLNAVKSGLTGKHLLFVDPQERADYVMHVDSYETEFQPVGPEERSLVQSIADIRWRLNQIPGLELAILATGSLKVLEDAPSGYAEPAADTALQLQVRRRYEKELRNLNLQENRLARRREREAAELDRRQTSRKANEAEALAEAAKAALLAQHNKQPLAKVPGLGFVFSQQRFTTFMGRLTPAQKQKLLQTALAEAAETPQTMEAAA